MGLCLVVFLAVVLLWAYVLVAMSVVAGHEHVEMFAVPWVVGKMARVLVAAVVFAVGVVHGRGICLRRLLRAETHVVGMVNCRLAVRWRSLCLRVGLCHGLLVARSRAGRSRVGALCRRAVVVTAVRCGAVAV